MTLALLQNSLRQTVVENQPSEDRQVEQRLQGHNRNHNGGPVQRRPSTPGAPAWSNTSVSRWIAKSGNPVCPDPSETHSSASAFSRLGPTCDVLHVLKGLLPKVDLGH